MVRVITPFGPGNVVEVIGDMVQVELDNLYKFGNREYYLWVFNSDEITKI